MEAGFEMDRRYMAGCDRSWRWCIGSIVAGLPIMVALGQAPTAPNTTAVPLANPNQAAKTNPPPPASAQQAPALQPAQSTAPTNQPASSPKPAATNVSPPAAKVPAATSQSLAGSSAGSPLFKQALADATKGNAAAQFKVGMFYIGGKEIDRDVATAAAWLRKAADQGHAAAQFNLAVLYTQGVGVPQDFAQAAKEFRKAAEQKDRSAQYNLG